MGSTMYVKTKNVYGRELVYPSCMISEKFARLLGVKSFSDNQLRDIIELGYKIEEDRQVGARLASHTSLINSIIKGE
jgi:hypothetical protein